MKVARRGKFSTLVTNAGDPVRAELYGCTVHREPHLSGGKTYATLDLTHATGPGVRVLADVDARIRRETAPDFSPLAGSFLVVKFAQTKYETVDGHAGYEFPLERGRGVDAVLKLGAFGSFGYCWTVERVKPRAVTSA